MENSFPDDPHVNSIYSHYPIENRHQISSINVRTKPEAPTYGTRFLKNKKFDLFFSISIEIFIYFLGHQL